MSRPRTALTRKIALGVAGAALLAGPAWGQLLGGGGIGVPQIAPQLPMAPAPRIEPPPARAPTVRPPSRLPSPGDVLPAVQGAADRTVAAGQALGAEAAGAAGAAVSYADAAARLLQAHPDVLEADARGAPVVRGEVLALAPSAAALARARQLGFRIQRTERFGDLGLETVTLSPPRGMAAAEALRRLQAADPGGQYDLNHIYVESGAAPAANAGGEAFSAGSAKGAQLGLVDGSVAARHPAFNGAAIEQRAFAPGGAKVSAHATAVASLMVGRQGRFRGAAPGARLRVADVYGPTPAGGSASAIARGLAWLAQTRTPVIDISLVGPPNSLLAAAVKALVARGHLIVAAVGNDGPAAPPLYPAAYPGVVSVTAVDARRQVLPEAGRSGHVDFAAPGAGLAAANPQGGYSAVRGTSFAAPLVAGALAPLLPQPQPAAAQQALARLARAAEDLGAPGVDAVYGRGLVGFALRTDPASVGARGLAMRQP